MSDVTNDSFREHVKTKTDAELETILDTYYNRAESPLRQAAVEEKYKRLKKRDEKNESIQKDICKMTKIILLLTIISLIIALIFGIIQLSK